MVVETGGMMKAKSWSEDIVSYSRESLEQSFEDG